MKRLTALAVVVVIALFGVLATLPSSAHADAGCPDPDQQIRVGYFRLGWNCNGSGDFTMRKSPSEGYQRLYDDNDASTGNIVHCNSPSGCDGYANWGGWDSGRRDLSTMVSDTFKYVPGLRWIDAKCFPTDCGVTRFFPSGTTTVVRPGFTPPPAVLPPATRLIIPTNGYQLAEVVGGQPSGWRQMGNNPNWWEYNGRTNILYATANGTLFTSGSVVRSGQAVTAASATLWIR